MEPKFWVLDSTFRFTLEKCSKLREPVYSPDNFWRIWVGPDDKKKYLRFCIKCKPQLVTDGWICDAMVEVRIISPSDRKPSFVRTAHCKMNKKTWLDFGNLLLWKSIMDPNKGFIENDEVLFEVHVISNYKSLVGTDDYTQNLLRKSQINVDELEMILNQNCALLQQSEISKKKLEEEIKGLKCELGLLSDNNKLLKISLKDKKDIIASRSCKNILENNSQEVDNNVSELKNKAHQLVEEKKSIVDLKAKIQKECQVLEEELVFTRERNAELISQLKKTQEDFEENVKNSCTVSEKLNEHIKLMKTIKSEIESLIETFKGKKPTDNQIINILQNILKMSVAKSEVVTENCLPEDIGNLQKHLQFILKVEEGEKHAREKTINKLQKKVIELLSELEEKDKILRKHEKKSADIDSFIVSLKKKFEQTQIDFSPIWNSSTDNVPLDLENK